MPLRQGKPVHLDTDHESAASSSSSQPTSSSTSKLNVVSRTLLAPFRHSRADSTSIFADLAPVIMTPKMMSHATSISSRPRAAVTSRQHVDFASLGRAPMRLGLGSRRVTSSELQVVEAADELLNAPIPDDAPESSGPSLLRGFQATIPSADKSRARRRQTRSVDTPHLGLKRRATGARGMLVEGGEDSEEDVVVVGGPDRDRGRKGRKRRGRESLAASKTFGREELERQMKEIRRDKENLHVRRSLIDSEIDEISQKIAALDAIRSRLEDNLLRIQEDELELDDELEMVKEQLNIEESKTRRGMSASAHMQSSRRRKGPAFLPSEHDDLPPGVAFMTLEAGTTPVTALDFSEPYGTLVTATQDESQPRVWDMLGGEEIGRLRGHTGTVKAVQVEDHICLTGSQDGDVRLWDLRRVDEDEWDRGLVHLDDVAEEDESQADSESVVVGRPNGIRQGGSRTDESEQGGPCIRVLGGHSKAVTALYFEEDTLVTGASDKTLRQWDLSTGQCVLTMDLLWALSHSTVLSQSGVSSAFPLPGAAAAAGTFAVPTPPYADGSWELYQDYIGACQFWGYALVSGSGDGAVRMWDMRTGQAHRTLLGHTGPVTSVQFDEIHVVSGSLDRSIRIWDLRTGGIFETIKYDHGVTSLQFDSRKVISATGENGVKIYNRTSMQHSTLATNGHTRPVEKLRYMDRYLVSGGRDSMVKIWAL